MTAFDDLLANPERRRVWLLEADPYDPVAPGVVTRRFSGGSDDPYFNGVFWQDRLKVALNYELDLMRGSRLGGGTVPSFGEITIFIGDGDNDELTGFLWEGREIRLWLGADDMDFADFGLRFKGTAAGVKWNTDFLTIALRDFSHKLDIPLQENKYAGTGLMEGGADLTGVVKPRAFGKNEVVAPDLLDATNDVYHLNDGSIQAVLVVRDRGLPLTSAGDVTTLSLADVWAWVPAAADAGKYITDLATGVIRLAAKPDGPLTVDFEGDNGAGYVDTTADIISRIVTESGPLAAGDLDAASFTALNTSRPWKVRLYRAREEPTIAQVLDELMAGVFGSWNLTVAGKLTLRLFQIGAATKSINPDNILAGSLERTPAQAAPKTVRVGYRRVAAVQAESDINLPISLVEVVARAEKRAPLLFWKLNERPSDGAADDHMIRFFGADKDGNPDVTAPAKVLKSDGTLFEFGGTADDGESSLQSPLEAGLCAFVVLETDGSKPFTHGFGPARHAALARKKDGVWQYKRRDAA